MTMENELRHHLLAAVSVFDGAGRFFEERGFS